ncbi:MAG: restriction endonuclease subunit S [Ruminococcus sp.]|uniref:restriction endonuclease subunit S n=1 Tax=Hominenteromicrobium sp. TaxID=3073581 RepID=UPI00399ADA37
MKSDKTTPNVPTLRFAEFSDLWEQKQFDEVLLILANNTLSRAELNYDNGDYKDIHYGDVLIKYPAYIDVSSSDVPYINTENSSTKLNNALLQNGDVVIADTAEDFTVGKATEIENVSAIKVVAGLHTIPCRPKMRFSPKYLGYYINSPAYHDQLVPFIQGVKVSSISKTHIRKTYLSFSSLLEQEKIANFLSCLDEKIKVQNKIIEDLKVLKKELCCKLLSNITEYKLLGELCSITTGRLDANANKPNGLYPFFTCGKETLLIDTYAFDGEAIMIAGNGDIGHTKYYCGKFNAYQRTYVLMNFRSNAHFIKMGIDTYLPRKIIEETQGGAMPYIKMSTLESLKIPYVSEKAQLAIKNNYDVIVKKLDQEVKMLGLLLKQKSFLLNTMFI